MFRHSCGKCHFTNTRRPSDITIADFWGWEKTAPDINKDDKGVSLILVNTEKGRKIFDAVKDRMTVIPAKLEDCLQQPNLWHPSVIHPLRMKFEKDFQQKGFDYVISQNYNRGLKYTIVENYRTLVKFIKNLVRKTIRKIKQIKD